MSSQVITPRGIEFIRALAVVASCRLSAVQKCWARDYQSITAADLRDCTFLTPAAVARPQPWQIERWRQFMADVARRRAVLVARAETERDSATIH